MQECTQGFDGCGEEMLAWCPAMSITTHFIFCIYTALYANKHYETLQKGNLNKLGTTVKICNITNTQVRHPACTLENNKYGYRIHRFIRGKVVYITCQYGMYLTQVYGIYLTQVYGIYLTQVYGMHLTQV